MLIKKLLNIKRNTIDMKIGKYKFNNKEAAETKIKALGTKVDENGNEYKTHKHTVVNLGNIILEKAVVNSEGETEQEAVFSDKWHVDCLWINLEENEDGSVSHPFGWAGKSIQVDGDGVHCFFGLNYNSLKF
jgi:hypothetical protein